MKSDKSILMLMLIIIFPIGYILCRLYYEEKKQKSSCSEFPNSSKKRSLKVEKINVKELDLSNPKAYGNRELDQIRIQMYEKYGSNFERQIKKMFRILELENQKALGNYRRGYGSYEMVLSTANLLDAFKRTIDNIAFDTNYFWECLQKESQYLEAEAEAEAEKE